MARLRIKEVSESKGIKQSHLQIMAAVTPPLLNRYWNNKSDSFSLPILEKIAKALKVKVSELIDDEEAGEEKDKSEEGKKDNAA